MMPVAALAVLAVGVSLAVASWTRRRGRPVHPLTAAIVLNALALVAPLTGYLAFLFIPASCAAIGAVVAAASPRRSWFAGTAASPWFLAPYLVWWAATASPDQVAAYGRVPWPFVGLAVACGGFGAAVGGTIRWLRGSPPAAENAEPGAAADGGGR